MRVWYAPRDGLAAAKKGRVQATLRFAQRERTTAVSGRPKAGRLGQLEVPELDLLGVTLFGFKFSGTFALEVAVVVVVIVVLVWFLVNRRRR